MWSANPRSIVIKTVRTIDEVEISTYNSLFYLYGGYWMKETDLIIMLTFISLFFSVLNLTPVHAEQRTSQKKEIQAKPQKEPKWEVHAGITRFWPNQRVANDYVHVIEGRVRQVAPGVRRF